MSVEVTSSILMRRKKPFRDEDGLVTGKLTEAIEVIPGNAAVLTIHIVIRGDSINVGHHGAYDLGIVVNLQAIGEDKCLRIRLANRALHQSIVMLCHYARPVAYHLNALAANPQSGPGFTMQEVLKRRHAGRWHKVLRKPLPVIVVVRTQQSEEPLFGVTGCRLLD